MYIKYFRLFYQAYAEREPIIRHKLCDALGQAETHHKTCGESSVAKETEIGHKACDVLVDLSIALEKRFEIKGFWAFVVRAILCALTYVGLSFNWIP